MQNLQKSIRTNAELTKITEKFGQMYAPPFREGKNEKRVTQATNFLATNFPPFIFYIETIRGIQLKRVPGADECLSKKQGSFFRLATLS